MELMQQTTTSARYAKCVEASKRIRWDIDRDVIRGRRFDVSKKFLPDGLSKAESLAFLSGDERRLVSQIQGRTYANIFGLVERYIAAKTIEISRDHWLGDQHVRNAGPRLRGSRTTTCANGGPSSPSPTPCSWPSASCTNRWPAHTSYDHRFQGKQLIVALAERS